MDTSPLVCPRVLAQCLGAGSGGGQGLGWLAVILQERGLGPDRKILGSRTPEKYSRVILKQHVPLETEETSHCSPVFAQRPNNPGSFIPFGLLTAFDDSVCSSPASCKSQCWAIPGSGEGKWFKFPPRKSQ